MKAIILNSGVGRRLKPITDEIPKCLIKLNKDTILGHQIKNLLKVGINKIIITTGPFEDKIKSFMKENFSDVNATYINNDKYESTNYIYSIWLTRNHIDDDILLIHGDTVFKKELLSRLIKGKNKTSVLIRNDHTVPKKDFKAEIIDDKINRIGINVFGKNAFFLAPIYKFSKKDFLTLIKEIENFVKRGELEKYAEDAFNNISDRIDMRPTFYLDEFCMEIDTLEDLEVAKIFFKNMEEM